MVIKAIETIYKGYRFRSRLEARWAVFFDAMGIAWQYEPQGYVLPGDVCYLPDFLLTDCATWIEVKGSDSALDRSLMQLAAVNLPQIPCRGESGPSLMILGPIPEPVAEDVGDWGWVELDRSEESYVSRGGFGSFLKNMRPWWHDGNNSESWTVPVLCSHEYGSDESVAAYRAARSARFEHGESGAPVASPWPPRGDVELLDFAQIRKLRQS